MAIFQYRPRTQEQMKKRETYSSDIKGYLVSEITLWKPKSGTNHIRILPATWDDPEHYGLDAWVHYQVGPERAAVLCLAKMKGERCPICEERARLDRQGLEVEAKELVMRRTVLYWIIDRDAENKGPQVFPCPPTLDQDIVKQSEVKSTGKYLMIDDPEAGYDVYFDKEGEKLTTKYRGVQVDRRATSVSRADIEFIVELPLPSLLVWRSYEEVQALFTGEPTQEHAPAREEPRGPIARRRPVESARESDNMQRERSAIDARTRDVPQEEDDEIPFEEPASPPPRAAPARSAPAASPAPISGSSRAAEMKARMQARNQNRG